MKAALSAVWLLAVAGIGSMPVQAALPALQVGLVFDLAPGGEWADPTDFPGPLDIMRPYSLVADGVSRFDDVFAGRTELEVEQAIRDRVEDFFRAVDTGSADTTLAIRFDLGRLGAAGSRNIALGDGQFAGSNVLGLARLGSARDPSKPDGYFGAVVHVDNIDSVANLPYSTFDEAINAIAGIAAHEIGHTIGLKHGIFDITGGFPTEPGSPPYPLMASGGTGLPNSALTTMREFKTSAVVPSNEGGGTQDDVALLIQNLGVVLNGDFDFDGDVDSLDLLQVSPFWQMGNLGFQQGDVNSDHVLNSLDFLAISPNFGSSLQSFSEGPLMTEDHADANEAAPQIPEPCGTALLAGASVLLLFRRPDRRVRRSRPARRADFESARPSGRPDR